MIEFKRYPHVRDLLEYYAKRLNNIEILNILKSEIRSRNEALLFSKFVLSVIDNMAKDMENNIVVLGSTDNTSMIPDIDYEISLYLANRGLEEVWDEVCDEN